VDFISDIAAIQQRIAQVTGAEAAPAVAPAAAAEPGATAPFGAYLAAMLAGGSTESPTAAMQMPVRGAITSEFGQRANPMGAGTEFHPGVDIAADAGTPIQAATGGRVIGAGPDGGYGNLVTVDDGNGLTTRYAHCSEILAQVGQVVSPGDVIATVGMTGRATGPHLHFEVRQDDHPVDPRRYLPE
jgi:murein DD-endopeptidase MepM/ murein hydrolase activator NlpD